MKKQILVLTMSMSLAVPMSKAVDFNPEEFKSIAMQLQGEARKYLPMLQRVVELIRDGDINGLENYLQQNIGNLDVSPALQFVRKNFGEFKGIMKEALDNVPVSQIPVDWQSKVQDAISMIRSNWNVWDMVESRMEQVIPLINLRNNIAFIASGLRKIADTPQFQALRPDLQNYFNTQIKPAYDKVMAADFEKIAQAMREVVKKIQGQDFDLPTLLNGLGEGRRVAPNIAGMLEGSMGLAVKINNALVQAGVAEKMPSELREGFNLLQTNATRIKEMLLQLNDEINKAKASMGF